MLKGTPRPIIDHIIGLVPTASRSMRCILIATWFDPCRSALPLIADLKAASLNVRVVPILVQAPFYPEMGRPSIDPELMIRMLIVGYVFAIRSERAIRRDVQVNFAYRWFCGLSIEDKIPELRLPHTGCASGDAGRWLPSTDKLAAGRILIALTSAMLPVADYKLDRGFTAA